jgi:hypothetical protein
MAMRLARARSELRLEFLLAFRHVELPTKRCRPVLLAMSSGDQRRQQDIDVAAHLASCWVCADLADPLLKRRRGAAARWLLPIPAWFRRAGHRLRTSRSTQAVTATAVVVAATAAVLLAQHPGGRSAADPTPTATAPPPTTIVTAPPSTTTVTQPPTTTAVATTATTTSPPAQPAPACAPPDATGAVAPTVGCDYTFTDLVVTEVPADEGFWVTFVDGEPMWVHLTSGTESPQQVRAGDHVTMQATIAAPDDGSDPGIPASQRDRLAARSVYLAVPDSALQVAQP